MISKDKQYRTRDGREVRIYSTDGGGEWPVHGAIKDTLGWSVHCWTLNGLIGFCPIEHDGDLIEVKPRIQREYWVNVYKKENYGTILLHETKEKAAEIQALDRIACVKVVIDCEEGEGL